MKGDKVIQKNLFVILYILLILTRCSDNSFQQNADLNYYFQTNAVDTIPNLFAPNIISTGHHEHSSLIISPDNTHLFFTIADNSQHIIMEIEKKNNHWGQSKVASFSGIYSDDRPFFSADGNKLYFESKRPISDSTKPTEWSIWYVEKRNGK